MTATAYPLTWPPGWKRTLPQWRIRAKFGQKDHSKPYATTKELTIATARQRLQAELDRLGADDVILSTNVQLRLDGLPRSDRGEPADTGAAIYFRYADKDTVLACDKWDRVADNINALAKHIEAMRGMDRWGVGTLEQVFTGYAALPAPEPWWKRLGMPESVASGADEKTIQAAWRIASRDAHPDRPGGSHDKMAAVNAARDEGIRLLKGE